jgi:hypothetical protein
MRKADDGKRWIFLSEIQGHIAMWAVRQSPYHNPEHLGNVLENFRWSVRDQFDCNDMRKMDRKDLRKMLERLYEIPFFRAWNERKNGNQAPYQFVSRYDGHRNPDNDFIDLSALTGNVVRSVFLDADREHQEDCRFQSKWREWWSILRNRICAPKPCTTKNA